jgi:hypothetical protein
MPDVVSEVRNQAAKILGTQEAANLWLDLPAPSLNQQRPIDLLATPEGVEQVTDLLARMKRTNAAVSFFAKLDVRTYPKAAAGIAIALIGTLALALALLMGASGDTLGVIACLIAICEVALFLPYLFAFVLMPMIGNGRKHPGVPSRPEHDRT